MPTIIAEVRFSALFVCPSVLLHNISKMLQPGYKLHIEIFHHESWKHIYFGSECQRSRSRGTKMCFLLFWVSTCSCWAGYSLWAQQDSGPSEVLLGKRRHCCSCYFTSPISLLFSQHCRQNYIHNSQFIVMWLFCFLCLHGVMLCYVCRLTAG